MENEKNNMKLDDAQRVRVLSPGMMVAKRFFRNRLAIVGLVIIICMFLFAFVGGAVNPYSQSEVFYRTEEMKKDYAGAAKIDEFQVFAADGVELPSDVYSKMILAVTKMPWCSRPEMDRHWHLAGLMTTHITSTRQSSR